MIHPSAPRKVLWDASIGMLILYSVIVVPYRICFHTTPSAAAEAVDWAFDCLFLVDMFVSFRTAYTNYEGNIISEPKLVAKH